MWGDSVGGAHSLTDWSVTSCREGFSKECSLWWLLARHARTLCTSFPPPSLAHSFAVRQALTPVCGHSHKTNHLQHEALRGFTELDQTVTNKSIHVLALFPFRGGGGGRTSQRGGGSPASDRGARGRRSRRAAGRAGGRCGDGRTASAVRAAPEAPLGSAANDRPHRGWIR